MTSLLVRGAGGLAILTALAVVGYVFYARHRYAVPGPLDRPARVPEAARRIGGFDLHVRITGKDIGATPVLVIHGGPGHSHMSLKGGFDFLSRDRLVVEYDQRGSGLSQSKPGVEHYTVDKLVQEIDNVRREVLGADRIILIGHSAGGALAQHYAIAHANRLERLILVGSTLANGGQSPRWLWSMVGPAIYATQLGLPPADADAADQWFAERVRPDEISRLHDPARVDILDAAGPNTFATWLAVSRSLAGNALGAELAHLDIPTLIVFGAADSIHTGAPAAHALQGLIPRSRSAEIPASGHWPFAENPDAFQAAVESFLAEPLDTSPQGRPAT